MRYTFFVLILISFNIFTLTSCSDDPEVECTATTWYEDADGDLLGNPDISQEACEQPDGYVSNADDLDDTDSENIIPYGIDASYFNNNSLVSFDTVACTLENGTSTTCYQMVFTSNPVADGPYCPETINDIGGVGVYDGNTNPGFQVMKQTLWEAMENDGYDIVDEDGNISIQDPGAGMGGGGSACLEASPDDNLILTFLIPIEPVLLSSPDQIGTVEHIGISVDGIPLTGDPPSVAQGPPGMPGGGGSIPAIDPCGGHVDPFGYYHLHFAPEVMNNVLEANDITEISCTNFTQDETALVGFAKDGYPIYASKDMDGSLPTDLDECFGHEGVTADFQGGIYHYHASSTEAPNLPPCVMGVAARNGFTYR